MTNICLIWHNLLWQSAGRVCSAKNLSGCCHVEAFTALGTVWFSLQSLSLFFGWRQLWFMDVARHCCSLLNGISYSGQSVSFTGRQLWLGVQIIWWTLHGASDWWGSHSIFLHVSRIDDLVIVFFSKRLVWECVRACVRICLYTKPECTTLKQRAILQDLIY